MGEAPEKLPRWKLLIFALGQLGWSLASYGVGSLVTYFYMPPETTQSAIFPPFLFQGAILGVFTIIGVITFVARVFDAVTNPLLASWSDRSRARLGRRRFFMLVSAVPFSVFSVLVFIPLRHFQTQPGMAASWINVAWLAVTILAFYFFFVMYTAPYNALISELGHNPKERLIISTAISVTWALGFAIGSFVYEVQGILEHAGFTSVHAFQTVQALFAGLSMVLMLLPVIFIEEHRYAKASVSSEGTMAALRSSLRNRGFVAFLGSELLYNVCQMIIQIGLVYYVTTLLRLEKGLTSLLIGVMFVLSFAFYPLVTWSALRYEKKRVLLVGFTLLSLLFLMFTFMGILPVPGLLYAWVVVGFAALPNAIFGIVPNAVVADIAEADGIETGNFKAGMFFGIRSFEINVGVSVANILFPSLLTLGKTIENPYGIRMSAIISSIICVAGMAMLFAYNETAVLRSLAKKEKLTGGAARELERAERPCLRRESVCSHHVAEPVRALLPRPGLRREIGPQKTEAHAESLVPLEVVQEAPVKVTAAVRAFSDGAAHRGDVVPEVLDALLIVEWIEPRSLDEREAVLGDDTGGIPVVGPEAREGQEEPLWIDLPHGAARALRVAVLGGMEKGSERRPAVHVPRVVVDTDVRPRRAQILDVAFECPRKKPAQTRQDALGVGARKQGIQHGPVRHVVHEGGRFDIPAASAARGVHPDSVVGDPDHSAPSRFLPRRAQPRVSQEEMMGAREHRPQRELPARRELAGEVPAVGVDGRLVDRDPVAHPVTQALEEQPAELLQVIDRLTAGKPALPGEPDRLFQVEDGDPGLNACFEQRVHETLVEIDAVLVDAPRLGQEPPPPHGEAIGADAEPLHVTDVLAVAAVVVAGNVAVGSVEDRARPVGELVPVTGCRAVGQRRSFDLVGCRCRAPGEPARKHRFFHGPSVGRGAHLSNSRFPLSCTRGALGEQPLRETSGNASTGLARLCVLHSARLRNRAVLSRRERDRIPDWRRWGDRVHGRGLRLHGERPHFRRLVEPGLISYDCRYGLRHRRCGRGRLSCLESVGSCRYLWNS